MKLLFALCLLLLPSATACARETPAEHAANVYASQQLAGAPPLGNLPDYTLPPASLSKAQHLATLRMRTHFLAEGWGVLQLILLLHLGGVGAMRDLALRTGRNRWRQGFTFALLFLAATTLLNLPLALYGHALGLRYGLSVQRWPGWLLDQAKTFALEWGTGGLLLMLLFLVIRRLPRSWWLAFWACTIPISVFSLFVMPYVEPLYNHYEPLARSHPALVQQLEAVAARGHMDIPPDRMFLMRASAKLTTLNADVEGFGHSKRVVVWDTAIAKLSPEQILFVFGHESGHYVLGHIVRGLLLATAGTFFLLLFGFYAVRFLLARFGARWRIPGQDDWAAVAVLLLVFSVLNTALEPVGATLSRMQEHAADVYGLEAIHGLVADPQRVAQTAFDVLGATSFEDPHPPHWFELWTYDHPATGRRAAFAHAYDPWGPGRTPKYLPK